MLVFLLGAIMNKSEVVNKLLNSVSGARTKENLKKSTLFRDLCKKRLESSLNNPETPLTEAEKQIKLKFDEKVSKSGEKIQKLINKLPPELRKELDI
jgi:hypothetical protein